MKKSRPSKFSKSKCNHQLIVTSTTLDIDGLTILNFQNNQFFTYIFCFIINSTINILDPSHLTYSNFSLVDFSKYYVKCKSIKER